MLVHEAFGFEALRIFQRHVRLLRTSAASTVKLKGDPRLGGQRSYDCVESYARKGRALLIMRVVKVFNSFCWSAGSLRTPAGHEELTPLDGHCILAINIPASQFDADQLYALYRLRWNAERQFMTLKSRCAFTVGKAAPVSRS